MLCIHLKRFRYDGFIPMKISNPIAFPLEGLSFKPFVIDAAAPDDCKYDLTAIVNHRGGVGGMSRSLPARPTTHPPCASP